MFRLDRQHDKNIVKRRYGTKIRTAQKGRLWSELNKKAMTVCPRFLYKNDRPDSFQIRSVVVLVIGLEPIWYFYRGILSPLRLPISPNQQIFQLRSRSASQSYLEAPPRLGLGVELLQSSALPLGYGAVNLIYSIKQIGKNQPFTSNLLTILLQSAARRHCLGGD